MTAEQRLCELFGFDNAVMFGRARSGLAALIDILSDRPNLPAAIPSNICPAVPAALGTADVRLVAVSPRSGLVPDDRLAAALGGARAGIAMPAYLYGFLQSYEETIRRARELDWFVLENDTCAATLTAAAATRTSGDALLVSFGHAKAIEIGCGGAVLTDDIALARELAARVSQWPPLSEAVDAIETHITLASRHLRALHRQDLAEPLVTLMADYTRYSFPESKREMLGCELDGLKDKLERRWERVALWENTLRPFDHELSPADAKLGTPWRLIRRVEKSDRREALVQALRRAGFDVGTNFPALSRELPSRFASQDQAEANHWAAGVINFWLTDDYDAKRIAAAGRVVEQWCDRKGVP